MRVITAARASTPGAVNVDLATTNAAVRSVCLLAGLITGVVGSSRAAGGNCGNSSP